MFITTLINNCIYNNKNNANENNNYSYCNYNNNNCNNNYKNNNYSNKLNNITFRKKQNNFPLSILLITCESFANRHKNIEF